MGASGQSSVCSNPCQTCGLLWKRCAGLWLPVTFYFATKSVWGIVCLFKMCFISWSLILLWNVLYKQVSSGRRAKHLVGARWEIWSRTGLWPAFFSSLQVCLLFLETLANTICQHYGAMQGQKGWHEVNLSPSHLYVHFKHLIREMGLA